MSRRRAVAAALVVPAILAVLAAAASPARSRDARDADRGRRLFVEAGCHGCHAIGALGAALAPDLSRIGARYDAAWLAAWLRDPRARRPAGHMPLLELTDEQVRELAAFLATLR